jgi:hypothetical protein
VSRGTVGTSNWPTFSGSVMARTMAVTLLALIVLLS